jgi:ketosteroid isomerase-like protein
MSQENVETFKRGIDAYNRQDVEAFLAAVDPEVEWRPGILTGLGGEAAVYRGYEGMREGLRDVYEALGETHLEYPEIRDLGDRVLGIGRFRTRGRKSGAETESPHATLVDFKDGKGIRIRAYLDPAEALEAAGLEA